MPYRHQVVAIGQARNLDRASRHETPAGAFQGDARGHDDDDIPEPADSPALDTEPKALDHLQHAADLQASTLEQIIA